MNHCDSMYDLKFAPCFAAKPRRHLAHKKTLPSVTTGEGLIFFALHKMLSPTNEESANRQGSWTAKAFDHRFVLNFKLVFEFQTRL